MLGFFTAARYIINIAQVINHMTWLVKHIGSWLFLGQLKVRKFQNENMNSSHCTNSSFIFWAMWRLHIFILKFSDLYIIDTSSPRDLYKMTFVGETADWKQISLINQRQPNVSFPFLCLFVREARDPPSYGHYGQFCLLLAIEKAKICRLEFGKN